MIDPVGGALRVQGTSKLAFVATTGALMTLASVGTAVLVNHATDATSGPAALPSSTRVVPDGGAVSGRVVVDRAPGTYGATSAVAPRRVTPAHRAGPTHPTRQAALGGVVFFPGVRAQGPAPSPVVVIPPALNPPSVAAGSGRPATPRTPRGKAVRDVRVVTVPKVPRAVHPVRFPAGRAEAKDTDVHPTRNKHTETAAAKRKHQARATAARRAAARHQHRG